MIKTNASCYGCGVCVAMCKFSAITMVLSSDGFFVPNINETKCTKCNLCDSVCSFGNETVTAPNDKTSEVAYGGATKDNQTLQDVTSGGIAFELAKSCLEKGHLVIGCKYDYEKQMAVHIIATNEEELKQTIGSKYIQSWTSDVFKHIDISQKYAIFGSPCQINSFRRFTRMNRCEENWLFVDFFCHGVPTYYLWRKYVDYHTSRLSRTPPQVCDRNALKSVKFRDKQGGWGIYTMTMTMTMTNGATYSRALNQNDFFLNMFLDNYALNKPCYSCKYHGLKSAADIRVGDFWGKKYEANKTGISVAIILSKTGEELWKDLDGRCKITNESIDVAIEGQISKDLIIPKNRTKIINELKKDKKSIAIIYFRYCFKCWRKYCLPKFVRKIVRSLLNTIRSKV